MPRRAKYGTDIGQKSKKNIYKLTRPYHVHLGVSAWKLTKFYMIFNCQPTPIQQQRVNSICYLTKGRLAAFPLKLKAKTLQNCATRVRQ